MMSRQQNLAYISYLIRLWPEDQQWRATVENVHNGERYAFGDLSALFDFVEGQTIEMLKDKKKMRYKGDN